MYGQVDVSTDALQSLAEYSHLIEFESGSFATVVLAGTNIKDPEAIPRVARDSTLIQVG